VTKIDAHTGPSETTPDQSTREIASNLQAEVDRLNSRLTAARRLAADWERFVRKEAYTPGLLGALRYYRNRDAFKLLECCAEELREVLGGKA
jgi:hypothetical protein